VQLYIAGALFTPAERSFLEEIAALCVELGFETYLPHRDGGILRSDRGNLRDLFARDLQALRDADAVVAVLNGPDVDSGTAWEIGYTFSSGKQVIALCEDFRIRNVSTDLNPMIAGSARITTNRSELRDALRTLL
jgi:nucleoside 2-deoxyribosyltransferase